MYIPDGDLDVLTLGEALVDLISLKHVDSLLMARCFERFQGGSPLNLAVNIAKLGGKSAVVAKIGKDVFGDFIKSELYDAGVCTDYILTGRDVHTSLVFVARTQGTPDFDVFRDADFSLSPAELDQAAIQRAKVVHATTWPLSREPFRSTVVQAFKQAHALGNIVSLDPNYSPRIWPDVQEARRVFSQIMRDVTITKPSLDDAYRLFGEGDPPQKYISRFHALGPDVVVFTMGAEGTLLSQSGDITYLPARKIAVVDATGAGDAFWAGFLTALLDGHTLHRCALFAREIAERKLMTAGPLPGSIDRHAVYTKIEEA